MRQRLHTLVQFALAVFVATSLLAANAVVPTGKSVEGEVLVKVRESASAADVNGVEKAGDVDKSEKISHLKNGALYRMHSRSKNTEALTTALAKNPNIEYVEPNYLVQATASPNDPSYGQLWGLKNSGQSINGTAGVAGADIGAEAAWTVTTGSTSVVVGVVDTGIDYTHPDLAANIWSNPGGKGNIVCGAGTHGFNAIAKNCDPKDDHYHGTHVSGTIGAVGNNNIGVVGVNQVASIMGLKFLNQYGSGTTADAIAAIDFAVQAKIDGVNIRILSNSWGGGAFSKALLDEINKAGENDILFVASAGNDGSNADFYPSYPAAYGTPNIISVAATDNRDLLAYFSNYGLTTVHLGAPGVSIYSTFPNNSYNYLDGTSMAAPHVSGVAALVLAHTPGLTTAQVKSAILDNTDPIPSLTGKTITGGRLNAARALGLPAPADFKLTVTPAVQSIVPGGSVAYSVNITPLNGFSGSVALSVANLPSGTTAAFNPASATTSSVVTMTTSSSTPVSSYQLTVTGVSGSRTRTAQMTLTVASAPQVTACPSFAFSYYYGVGRASALALADLNRDGRPDLITVGTTNKIVVVPSSGSGSSFGSTASYDTGSGPIAVATGDFNGDGKADVATANSAGGNVSVLLGNGDGTLQTAVNYAAGSSPFAVATGDFNRDGKLDLAVANNAGSNVSILLGNGDGTFQPPVNSAAASGPYFIATGDFDADGKLDLAVASYNTNKVMILLGNGDGTFAAPVGYTTAIGPSWVATGDLNGDGKLDLAVTNYGSGNVSVLLGNGNGTFGSAANYNTAYGPSSVAIADLDGDGKSDLAVSNNDSGTVSELLGTGSGTFLAATSSTVDPVLNQLAAADLNNDGRTDIVVISAYYGELGFLFNTSSCKVNCGILSAPADQPAGTTPMSAAAGDFNRDGKLDYAVANNGSNNVSIKSGNGDGTFQAAVNSSVATNPISIVAGDFNRDGKLDVATANDGSGNVSVLLGNGDATFQATINSTAGTNPRSIASGDFNRDGKLDVAVADYGSNDVAILAGNGDGTFQAPVTYSAGTNPSGVAAGDLNRDGILDLAVANAGSANVSIFLGNSNGTFQAATNITAGTTPYALVIADVNGDGKPDLAVANSGSSNISVFIGNGNGTFQSAATYGAGTNPHGITAADFNSDGKLDLAVANNGLTNASLFFGDGAGGFGSAVTYGAGLAPAALFSADFNADGKSDLAVVNSGGSGSVSILVNNCLPPDLTVAVSHSGTFAQGSSGNQYTITVSNIGTGPTSNVVSVTDTLPASMTATAMSGSGWTCSVSGRSCLRTDPIGAGGIYPPITLTVSVSGTAPASVTNSATVYGGGEINTGNNTATDPTTITGAPDLAITSLHSGSFTRGDTARTFQLTVTNLGGLATDGSTVTVSDTLPAGLNGTGISGTGWTCNGSLTCTRSDTLAAGASYPAITITVNVASNAGSPLVNLATVSGGGETNVSNDTASDPTVVWAPQGCSGIGAAINFSAGYSETDLAAADFNGDGRPDLVTVNNNSSGTVSVLIAKGNNTFASAVSYAVGGYPTNVAVADFNNDGKPDLVVANSSSTSNNTAGLSVLLGNGDGTFAPAVNYSTPSYPQYVTVADFNGDGNLDAAAVLGSSQVVVMFGHGDGTLQAGVPSNSGGSVYGIASGDFNHDGKMDLVETRNYYGLNLLLGNGDGTFQAPVTISTTYMGYRIAVADFNHDGNPDIVSPGYYDNNMYVFLGNGDGTFQTISNASGYGSSKMVVDDVNGDGKPDVTFANGSYLVTMMGNGDGTLGAPAAAYLGSGGYNVVISDFNGDGRPDYAVSGYSAISIYTGACTDLSITKTHYGSFIGGQTGTYTITVSNSGGSSVGTVTVTDNLPSPLTVSSLSGYGWTCNSQTVSCTRSDSIGGGNYYPSITLVVNVPRTQASSVINTATVSGGGDSNLGNNTASDPTTISQAPDLIITMNHSGNFAQGQTGKTFTITVGNNGGAPTSGTVTVTGTLPSSLTATGLSGTGWNCTTLGSITCARSDALAVTSSYPPITLTVSVSNTAPTQVTANAYVSGGGETNTSNNYVYDTANVITTALNVNAVAVSGYQVSLSWDPVLYATSYQVFRSASIGAPFVLIGTPLSNSFVDATASFNTTYLYKVAATDGSNTGPLSQLDIATTYFFNDDPIVVRSTKVKALHIGELRAAINIVRAAAGLGAASYTDPTLNPGMYIKAVHFSQLRAALDAARSALGLPPMVYTDPSLTSGVTIKAAHIRDLRAATK